MSAPTQPEGPELNVTLTHQAESAEMKVGPAVMVPRAFFGCVPMRVPSAVARTLVWLVVKIPSPTKSGGAGGLAAESEGAENDRVRTAMAIAVTA
jgi:hypothetical protein